MARASTSGARRRGAGEGLGGQQTDFGDVSSALELRLGPRISEKLAEGGQDVELGRLTGDEVLRVFGALGLRVGRA